ncbi:MAG: TolC family protein [Bacillota bacterium]
MLKKVSNTIFILFFIMIITSAGIMAVEGDNIGLQDIIDLAMENNLDLKLAELNLDEAEIEFKKSQLNNLISNSRLLRLQSELQMVQAEENFNNTRDGVTLDVISKYIELISLDQEIAATEKEVELEKRKVTEVDAQVEVGYKGNLDLFEQETTYISAVNSREKSKDEYEQKLSELKQVAVVGDDVKIKLVELEKPELWEVNEEKMMSEAVENNNILNIKEKQVSLAQDTLKKARVSEEPALDIQQKQIDLQRVKLELNKEKESLENDVKNKYLLFKQAIKNMNMADKAVTQAEEHYKIIIEQNEAGLISKNDLLSSEVNFFKAENRYIDSIINYYINMLQLKQAVGMELEVNIDSE